MDFAILQLNKSLHKCKLPNCQIVLLHRNLAHNLADLDEVATFREVQRKGLVVAIDADGSNLGACKIEDFHYFPVGADNVDVAAINAQQDAGNAHLDAVGRYFCQHGNGSECHRQRE